MFAEYMCKSWEHIFGVAAYEAVWLSSFDHQSYESIIHTCVDTAKPIKHTFLSGIHVNIVVKLLFSWTHRASTIGISYRIPTHIFDVYLLMCMHSPNVDIRSNVVFRQLYLITSGHCKVYMYIYYTNIQGIQLYPEQKNGCVCVCVWEVYELLSALLQLMAGITPLDIGHLRAGGNIDRILRVLP